MSFILDALRKSESERQREAAPTLTRAPLAPHRRRTPVWTWAVIVGLSLALLALGATLWLDTRDQDMLAPATVTEMPTGIRNPGAGIAPPPPVPVPAATQPQAVLEPVTDAPPRAIAELAALNPALPDYELDFIAYDGSDPAQSSAWINGRRYFSGENIGNGVMLAEVGPDSVILSYQGARFLLRP
jgi:general secretion pathway protein B